MSATLLAISSDMERLEALLEESGGEVTPAVEEALATWGSNLEGQMENKVDAYAALYQELTLRAEARAKEAKRLMAMAGAGGRAADFLKARLKMVFELHKIKKLETQRFTVSLVNNGGVAPLEICEEAVPIEWCSPPADPPPDKARIRAALEAGELLSFAKLGERGTSLRIK